jgi:hypothetical protein
MADEKQFIALLHQEDPHGLIFLNISQIVSVEQIEGAMGDISLEISLSTNEAITIEDNDVRARILKILLNESETPDAGGRGAVIDRMSRRSTIGS